ncbi:hypothetical protein CCYS_01435 [Corynebacterium cystitidis DSM 20524]|uniref:Fido domain-containing protein n=2 Tax=Corynebacterium cystitidis TaxID=35757 RepID=A0A1H9UAP4_9CORY|nr:hypothetical protein CCYS_01435 [Corynebacterium cystitidis DSM 20524]SES06402.1 hypothetical protein SAMN05661109_01757 [Corynebacterium cystitidis DSM 20524]SNV88843.1 Uncharacterised protein [Corynebacterium cystitidis]
MLVCLLFSEAIVEDMPAHSPLSPYLELGDVPSLVGEATSTIARAHRRPAALRRAGVIVSESVLRGAKLSALLDGEEIETHISPYAMLSPETAEAAARTFRRAPAQVFARLDVAAGGPGRSLADDGPARLTALARLITGSGGSGGSALDDGLVLAAVVHCEIVGRELFGPRSGVVGRVAARCVLLASGVDPLGIAVPETYYHRHKADYAAVARGWATSSAVEVTDALEFMLRAFAAGGVEADGIAQAA